MLYGHGDSVVPCSVGPLVVLCTVGCARRNTACGAENAHHTHHHLHRHPCRRPRVAPRRRGTPGPRGPRPDRRSGARPVTAAGRIAPGRAGYWGPAGEPLVGDGRLPAGPAHPASGPGGGTVRGRRVRIRGPYRGTSP